MDTFRMPAIAYFGTLEEIVISIELFLTIFRIYSKREEYDRKTHWKLQYLSAKSER